MPIKNNFIFTKITNEDVVHTEEHDNSTITQVLLCGTKHWQTKGGLAPGGLGSTAARPGPCGVEPQRCQGSAASGAEQGSE